MTKNIKYTKYLLITLFTLILFSLSWLLITYKKQYLVNAKDEGYFDISQFQEEINITECIEFNKVFYIEDNVKEVAEIYCFDPNNNAVSVKDGVFKPSLVGTYKFNVFYKNFKKDFEVRVVSDNAKIFTGHNVNYVTNYDLPTWSESGNGVVIYTDNNTDANMASARLNNIINLHELSSDIPVIEFQVLYGNDSKLNKTFSDMGLGWQAPESQDLKVVLTDIYDSSKKITISWRAGEWYYYGDYHKGFSYMMTSPKTAYLQKWYTSNGVTVTTHTTFEGQEGKNVDSESGQLFNFCFDYLNNSSYYYSDGVKTFLSNYSNVDEWKDYSFDKFTTGEVYLDIYIGNGFTGSGGIVVTKIGGESLSGDVVKQVSEANKDNYAPQIYINLDEDYLTKMPTGYVNIPYSVPVASAIDAITGNCEVIMAVINKSTKEEYEIIDGRFIPDVAGLYTINYFAYDGFGCFKKKSLDVEIINGIQDKISFNFVNVSEACVGDNYLLPSVEVSGGSGKINYSYIIKYNNEIADVKNGKIYLDKVGTIEYIFTAEDYLKTALQSNTLEIEVKSTNKVFMTINGYIPKYCFKDQNLILPDMDVYCSDGRDISKEIKINGSTINELSYFVSDNVGDNIEIVYKASTSTYTTTETFFVKVLENSQNCEDKLIITNYSKKCLLDDCYEVDFNSGSSNIELPNYIASDNIVFDYLVNFADVRSHSITFKDISSNTKLIFNFSYNSKTKKVVIDTNGESFNLTPKLIDGNNVEIYFLFDTTTSRIADKDDSLVGYVTLDYNKDKFYGFNMNICSAEINFNFDDESKVKIYSIGNQSFDKFINIICIGPQIVFSEFISNCDVSKGTEVTIPTAFGSDIIDGYRNAYVTVTSPSGKKVVSKTLANKEISFIISEDGLYNITYSSTDSQGGKNNYVFYYNCKDIIAPTIEVSFENTSIKKGQILNFPDAKYSDNVTTVQKMKYYVFIYGWDRNYINITEVKTYTFDKVGNYRLVYLIIDESNNMTRKEFVIQVS